MERRSDEQHRRGKRLAEAVRHRFRNEVGGGEAGGIDTYQNHGVTAAQIDHRVAVDHGRAGEALAGSVMDWGGIDYGWPLLQTSEDALESLRGLPDEPRLSSEEPE
jgi:hypothetical protein